MKEREGDCKR